MTEHNEEKEKAAKAERAAEAKKKALAHKKANEGKASKSAPPAMAVSDGREVKHAHPRLKKHFAEKVVPEFQERMGLTNPLQVPRLTKVVVNMGVSEAKENVQLLDQAREELAVITGQWPQLRRAHKSISNFKLRQGMPIGLRVTMRGDRMYEFMDRLISVAIPRIRDFRGLELKGFDGRGNFNLGLREQMIFPEVDVERATRPRGMNISIVTTAENDEIGLSLLRSLGLPFKKEAPAKKSAAGAQSVAAGPKTQGATGAAQG